MCAHRVHRFVWLAVVLLSLLTAVQAQSSRATDPYGRPLPSHAQQLAELQRLLHRTIVDHPALRHDPLGTTASPYDGPDAGVAYLSTATSGNVTATPADLAQTPDVQFTPEVQNIVATYRADPLQLYLYVKNGYDFTPYLGSQKGSRGTELEFAGNDYDQASLLIALLRDAGIPARYVFGSMKIPLSNALNWLRVDNVTAALDMLQWQGIPAKVVKAGGGALVLDRVWVEALIDVHGPNPRWVPMDPAYKQYQITPASPLATAVAFDSSAYLSLAPGDERTAYQFLAGNLQNYLNTAAPGTTVAQVVRQSSIVPTSWTQLPSRLENHAHPKAEAAVLTDAQRYLVVVSTVDAQGLSAQAQLRLPEVYGQRLTVSFPPATAADQQLVQQDGGYYNVPADQLHVVASINVNGQAVATGSRPVAIGAGHYIVVDFYYPGATQPDTVFHEGFAGEYYGLGLDVQGDASMDIQQRGNVPARVAAAQASSDPQYDDNVTGESLSLAAWVYLDSVQKDRVATGALFSANQVMDVSEALTMHQISMEYINGVLRFQPIGWTVDAKRVNGALIPANGNYGQAVTMSQVVGLGSSLLESRLWDRWAGLQSISTTRGLQWANANGISILHIDASNAATLLPTLNVFPGVLYNIENEINAGYSITIPQSTFIMNSWIGSVWIMSSSDGTPVGFLIEGGLFGGSTTQPPKVNPNPSCSTLDSAFDTYSGPFNSDMDRAVSMHESSWTQFDPNDNYAPLWSSTGDVGLMQVNEDANEGSIRLPDGTSVTLDDNQLENNWQYNLEIGEALFNSDLVRAQNYLISQGDTTPTDADLVTVAYYIYNHGSNIPPGFQYSNGQLSMVDYSKDTNITAKHRRGIRFSQNAALDVQNAFTTQRWVNNPKRGCQ